MGLLRRTIAKVKRDGLPATIAGAVAAARAALDFRYRAAYGRMLQRGDMQDRFTAIYDQNLWSSGESGSGLGSEVEFTRNLRGWLVEKVPHYGIETFVDAPCGDFNWMRLVLPQLEIDYVGLDIVESVVQANTARYGTERTRFAVANICEDPIPPCDLLMVRDCLFHLSYADISRFLANLAATDFRYLLTTTHLTDQAFANRDITSGDFRLIDLCKPPFGFDPATVIDQVDDFPPRFTAPRRMVLIAKADVPAGLDRAKG